MVYHYWFLVSDCLQCIAEHITLYSILHANSNNLSNSENKINILTIKETTNRYHRSEDIQLQANILSCEKISMIIRWF